jgi:hypothetical protein
MDSRSEKHTVAAEPPTKPIDRAGLRPWIAPTFERLSLNDAMAGIRNVGVDLGCS